MASFLTVCYLLLRALAPLVARASSGRRGRRGLEDGATAPTAEGERVQPRLAAVAVLAALLWASPARPFEYPALRAEITDALGQPRGTARIYRNFVRLHDATGQERGAVGVVIAEGYVRLFLVQANDQRTLIGWSRDHRLYDAQNKLVGYYNWTPTWSYVYSPTLKKVGQAQCLAYQGVCAAGVAGFLLGLF
ncbi:MAG: hypothetical protein HY423_01450 [Candidatus Lambdaproteobacteria bacterium]|nr:hypothetical protein [Candidatus Lambdaproteobacteria bacterium]